MQEILGRDHRDLVVLLNNLSVVMHKNGRNAQAEILQRRALEIGKEKLGSRHEQVWLPRHQMPSGNMSPSSAKDGGKSLPAHWDTLPC